MSVQTHLINHILGQTNHMKECLKVQPNTPGNKDTLITIVSKSKRYMSF